MHNSHQAASASSRIITRKYRNTMVCNTMVTHTQKKWQFSEAYKKDYYNVWRKLENRHVLVCVAIFGRATTHATIFKYGKHGCVWSLLTTSLFGS